MRKAGRDAARGSAEAAATLVVESPMGPLTLSATDQGLSGLAFGRSRSGAHDVASPAERRHLVAGARWLKAYFARREGPLPSLAAAGTDFQRRVWQALTAIPACELVTYADVARAIDRPAAVRAVGQAVGANPLPLFVPCHRVIAAGGKLGGFSAGLPRKRWLLRHEGHTPG